MLGGAYWMWLLLMSVSSQLAEGKGMWVNTLVKGVLGDVHWLKEIWSIVFCPPAATAH
jgi:hypothetical protein